MYELRFSEQAALEREMKRRRVPLWGAGYPLHDLEEVTRVDTEPAAKRVAEAPRIEVKREPVPSRWRATLNLIRLSFE